MNGIKLTYESTSVSTGARPASFEELVRLAEVHFPHLQIETARYVDEEGDEVAVRNDKDLREALRLAIDVWQRQELEVKLLGRPLTTSFMTESVAQGLTPQREEAKTEAVQVEPMAVEGTKAGEVSLEPPAFIPVVEESKEVTHSFSRMRLSDPECSEERYLMCYKCNGDGKTKKSKPCRLCEATGVINVATHPKFQRITELVREEIRATLARIQVPEQRFEVPSGGERHEGVTCDSCDVTPIVGARFKCSICDNFDYCESCERTIPHPHPFIKIRSPDVRPARIVTVVEEDAPTEPVKKRKVHPTVLSCVNTTPPSQHAPAVHLGGACVKVTWKMSNAGSVLWPPGCMFQCVSGAQGPSCRLPQVGPGESYEVEVAVTLPQEPGTAETAWQAIDPAGAAFGQVFTSSFSIESPAARITRQAQVLRDFMQRDAVLAASVLESCGGNIELTNEKLAQLLG